jgi:hypothetical protein
VTCGVLNCDKDVVLLLVDRERERERKFVVLLLEVTDDTSFAQGYSLLRRSY